jgi:hypothetical protein
MLQVSMKTMEELSQSGVGKFIVDLAQMHAELRGPLEDLIQTILDLEDDLREELKQLDANYQRRSNEHVRIVTNLEQEIGSAEIDIASW